MAKKSQIIDIPLVQPINLDKLKTTVTPYEGFETCNSPFVNNSLSSIYTRDFPGGTVDVNDNIFRIDEGVISVNNRVIGNVEDTRFEYTTEDLPPGTLLDYKYSDDQLSHVSIVSDDVTYMRYVSPTLDIETPLDGIRTAYAATVHYFNGNFYVFILDDTTLKYGQVSNDTGTILSLKTLSVPYATTSSKISTLIKDNFLLVQVWDVSGVNFTNNNFVELPIYVLQNSTLVQVSVTYTNGSGVESLPRIMHPDGKFYNHTANYFGRYTKEFTFENPYIYNDMYQRSQDYEFEQGADQWIATQRAYITSTLSTAVAQQIDTRVGTSALNGSFTFNGNTISITVDNVVELNQASKVTVYNTFASNVVQGQRDITNSSKSATSTTIDTSEQTKYTLTLNHFSLSGKFFTDSSVQISQLANVSSGREQPSLIYFYGWVRINSVYTVVGIGGDSEVVDIFFSNADEIPLMKSVGLYNGVYYRGTLLKRFDWNLLVNAGFISGISHSLNDLRGTTVSDWLSIDNDFRIQCEEDYIVFKQETPTGVAKIFKVEKLKGASLRVVFNNYLVVNTTSFLNFYDIQKGSWSHAFDDYNDRIVIGKPIVDGDISYVTTDTRIIGSATNPLYEISDSLVPGTQFPPFIGEFLSSFTQDDFYYSRLTSDENITTQSIQLFFTTDSTQTAPPYYRTFTKVDSTEYYYTESNFVGQVYPIPSTSDTSLLAATLFDRYTQSFTKQDLVRTMSDTLYVVLLNNNSQPLFAYKIGSQVSDVENTFTIQGTSYILKDNYIFRADFIQGNLQQQQAIVEIKGLEFVANSTTIAYFYSTVERSLYTFVGDRSMSKQESSTEISDIFTSTYQIAANAVVMATNMGVIFTNSMNTFVLPYTNVDELITTDSYLYLRTPEKLVQISYFPKEGSTKIPVKFSTRFYGVGNNQVSNTDCYYFRLFSDKTEKFTGKFICSIDTLTDTGFQSEERVFTLTEKDFKFGMAYIRYQPRYQRSVGSRLKVESDFDIYELSMGTSSIGTPQVSNLNL